MEPERQALLLAVAAQVSTARDRLTARLAMADTIAMRPKDFTAEELMNVQTGVRESLAEVDAWCGVFEREAFSSPDTSAPIDILTP